MYDTLIMVKSEENFSPKEMHRLVEEVCVSGKSTLGRTNTSSTIRQNEAFIQIDFADSEVVASESREIAKYAGMDCAEITRRFEMHGRDDEMTLFNDYMLLLEKISATGKFHIFDSAEGQEYVG